MSAARRPASSSCSYSCASRSANASFATGPATASQRVVPHPFVLAPGGQTMSEAIEREVSTRCSSCRRLTPARAMTMGSVMAASIGRSAAGFRPDPAALGSGSHGGGYDPRAMPFPPSFAWLVLSLGAQDGVVLPSGAGIAARYPGDRGIGADPAVLLFEDFEGASLEEVLTRWTSAKRPRPSSLARIEDVPAGSAGAHALRITAVPERDSGGHLYTPLERGVDRLFARFYVKFPREGHGYVHHFVHVGGYEPATPWPQGGAGERPAGDERVTVGIEPFGENGRLAPPGRWGFYAYWHEMKRSADGRYWGNGLTPREPQHVPVDRWQCVEVMVALNTPGERDGELALWLDGDLVAHFARGVRRGPWTGMGFGLVDADGDGEPFEGFSWRTSVALKLDFFWLLHYVTPEALTRNGVEDTGGENVVLFDQIVVAESYVGPLEPLR